MTVWDRDITRKAFMGGAAVPLHALPHDGSWSDVMVRFVRHHWCVWLNACVYSFIFGDMTTWCDACGVYLP